MKFENGIAIYDYIAKAGLGVHFTSKTFLIQDDKNIYIISPANFNDETIKYIKDSEKSIRFIAPNNFHNLHLKTMFKHFPNAHFYGPKRSQKQSGVQLEKTELLASTETLVPVFIQGHELLSETCFLHKPSESLIITDLFFNMHHKMNIQTSMAMRLVGTYHKFGMSRMLKKAINDKKLFKTSLLELEKLSFKKVLLNHGDSVSKEVFIQFIKGLF